MIYILIPQRKIPSKIGNRARSAQQELQERTATKQTTSMAFLL